MTDPLWKKLLPGLLTQAQLDQLADSLVEAIKHGHAEVTIQVKNHKPRFIVLSISSPLPFDGQPPQLLGEITKEE